MIQYKLVMTSEQEVLLAKHLGQVNYMYREMYKLYDKDGNEQMKQLYQTYINEVDELIHLLLTVFNKGD